MLWQYQVGKQTGFYLWTGVIKKEFDQPSVAKKAKEGEALTFFPVDSNCQVEQQERFFEIVRNFVSGPSPQFAWFPSTAKSIMGSGRAMISPAMAFRSTKK